MKRWNGLILAAVVVLTLVSVAAAQSLGDAAKHAREQEKKSATKVYTEEDLRTVPASKMAEEAQAEAAASNSEASKETPAENAATTDEAKKDGAEASGNEGAKEMSDKDSPDAAAKQWNAKISDQEQEVKSLEKELDLMQRENKLRQASYYGDAGNQLRDQKKWADEQRQYQEDLDAKQKALTDAKQRLDETREQARKSGVPSSQVE